MDYVTDWMMLALALGLCAGGISLGRRTGPLTACWLAGGAWLALGFADRLWRPVISELRLGDRALDLEFWLPVSYALLFGGLLLFVVIWVLLLKPDARELELPGRLGEGLSSGAGACAGLLVLLAVAQSQAMSLEAEKRIPRALGLARPVLTALGQHHVAPFAGPAPGTKTDDKGGGKVAGP